jgi:uncharacterized protein (DUF1778 family)
MSDETTKKGRGRPPASFKPDARRIATKLRWTEEEIEAVRAAASAIGEDVSHFIRSVTLAAEIKIQKNFARSVVSSAKQRGKLSPSPCEVCGEPKTEAHHDDYTLPLNVRWLCRKHHKEVHYPLALRKPKPIPGRRGRKAGSCNKHPKTDALRVIVMVRLSEVEKAELQRCAKLAGETESEFVRGAINLRCEREGIS